MYFSRRMLALFVAAMPLALTFPSTQCTGSEFWSPSECEECRSPERIVAPGIGFDLTHAYGTVAIRFQNGSTVYLGKVDGDEAYRSMMEYRSRESSRPERPDDFWSRVRYRLERQRRAMNKRLGRPATKEVGIIASLLADLCTISANYLHHPITVVVALRPSLPGFDTEDLSDALSYVGIASIHQYQRAGKDISPNAAVYAGTGKGLCTHPEDVVFCEDEEYNMPNRFQLSISFTNAALSLSYGGISSATTYWEWMSRHYTDLGLAKLSGYLNENNYWEDLRAAIREFARQSVALDLLQIYGEEAADERFKETLKAALRDLKPDGEEEWSWNLRTEVDPVELAARGAAELAKHFQEMTNGCVEPRECNEGERALHKPVFDL